MILFKSNVSVDNLTQELYEGLLVVEEVYEQYGYYCMVTSSDDGQHGPGTLHGSGKAADIRTRHLPEDVKKLIYLSIKRRLEPMGFDVVLESTHIHLEFDPD